MSASPNAARASGSAQSGATTTSSPSLRNASTRGRTRDHSSRRGAAAAKWKWPASSTTPRTGTKRLSQATYRTAGPACHKRTRRVNRPVDHRPRLEPQRGLTWTGLASSEVLRWAIRLGDYPRDNEWPLGVDGVAGWCVERSRTKASWRHGVRADRFRSLSMGGYGHRVVGCEPPAHLRGHYDPWRFMVVALQPPRNPGLGRPWANGSILQWSEASTLSACDPRYARRTSYTPSIRRGLPTWGFGIPVGRLTGKHSRNSLASRILCLLD